MLRSSLERLNHQSADDEFREQSLSSPPLNSKHDRPVMAKSEVASAEILTTSESAWHALSSHVESLRSWASQVSFADLRNSRDIRKVYIELDTFVTPTRLHVDTSERQNLISLKEAIFGAARHCILLGHPGAGKTTAMKRLYLSLVEDAEESEHHLPILIRFKEISHLALGDGKLVDEIAEVFRYKLDVSGSLNLLHARPFARNLIQSSFLSFLDSLNTVIILEGFDELPHNLDRNSFLTDLRILSKTLKKSKVVLTCRTGEFNYLLENSQVFEIAPLDRKQIRSFVDRWLQSMTEADDFFHQLLTSPFSDTAMKPLSLAHLCALYERIGHIPEKPKTVYRKLVNLLLEEWDEQRLIKRMSKYANFETDRKFDFLSHLAYDLTRSKASTVFSHRDFLNSYGRICDGYGLSRSQANDVVAELESHTGLFVQSGYEKFEFAHKSLQEYLSAEYIVKLPSIPLDQSIIENLGHEVAIAISLSSNPAMYLSELWNKRLRGGMPGSSFLNSLVNRISLERPEFVTDDACVLQIFGLLSMWLNDGRPLETLGGHRRFVAPNWNVYDAVADLLQHQVVKTIINKYYEILHPQALNDLGLLLCAKRKTFSNEYAVPQLILLSASYAKKHIFT